MQYVSTRDPSQTPYNFNEVTMLGLASDSGLFVPQHLVTLPQTTIDSYGIDPYDHDALTTMQHFVGKAIPTDNLQKMVFGTYNLDNFGHRDIAPLAQLDNNLKLLELWYGPTLAFKDYALQLLGKLFSYNLGLSGGFLNVLGATSGDTGSAAIYGLRGLPGITTFILYPNNGTSLVQERQMTSVMDKNVHAIAIDGDFDDGQKIVKTLSNDAAFKHQYKLGAVNSINWARLAAQVVYFARTAVAEFRRTGKLVDFVIPTGNFGDIFAGYIAKHLGFPIGRLVIATNENDILHRFLNSGTMARSAKMGTNSPSMDIQDSSNFERLLYYVLGQDPEMTAKLMKDFAETDKYTVPVSAMKVIRETFMSGSATNAQTLTAIKRVHKEAGYVMDTHTAVAVHVADELFKKGLLNKNNTVILSTAHAAKFPDEVKQATGTKPELPPHLDDLYDRPFRKKVIPATVDAVRQYMVQHARLAP